MIAYLGVDKQKMFDIIRNFEYFDLNLNQIKEFNSEGMSMYQMLMGTAARKFDEESSVVRYLKAVERLLEKYPDYHSAAEQYANYTEELFTDLSFGRFKEFIDRDEHMVSSVDFPKWLDIYLSIKGL